ncbi:MAG: NACHT domain-containing protein [Pseudanabaena sp. ELA645]
MSIKQEQTIREFVKRFEALLLGFPESEEGRECNVSEISFNLAIVQSARRYAKNYLESHAFTQLIGGQQLLTLSSIYIPQRFQTHTSIRRFDSVEELEEAFSHDLQRSSSSKGTNLIGLNIANDEEYLTILGLPATGKTTFLKYIGLEALHYPDSRYKHNLIPIFLPMWKFCRNTDTLLLAIAEELEMCEFTHSQELARWLLNQGKLLILIDGLNEATLPQKHLSNQLKDFVKLYPQNRYIVSSRLANYQNSLGQFLELAIQPWSDLHIQEYIHKWFAITYDANANSADTNLALPNPSLEQDTSSEKAQYCWQILQANESAKELAKSPLCLSFLCFLCDHRYSFPRNISGLYQKTIRLILEEQVLKYQLLEIGRGAGLSTDILDLILNEAAYKGFELQQTLLPFDQIKDNIQTVLTSCTGSCYVLEVDFVLQVLQQTGLCKIISSGTFFSFGFSHITFQEYFVACQIYNHNQVRALVTNHLSDRRWQQVFLLLAGLMVGNVEELLLCIESEAISYINTRRLRYILEWVDQISLKSSGEIKPIAKRIALFFLARPRFLSELAPELILIRMLHLAHELYEFFDLSLDFEKVFEADLSMSIAHALDLDSETQLNLTVQLCNNLEQSLSKLGIDAKYINFTILKTRLDSLQSQIPSYDQPFKVREEFRYKIIKVWSQTLHLPAELNQISQQEVDSLKNYFYANLLMVQCQKMAVTVSPKTWKEIESQMLCITN